MEPVIDFEEVDSISKEALTKFVKRTKHKENVSGRIECNTEEETYDNTDRNESSCTLLKVSSSEKLSDIDILVPMLNIAEPNAKSLEDRMNNCEVALSQLVILRPPPVLPPMKPPLPVKSNDGADTENAESKVTLKLTSSSVRTVSPKVTGFTKCCGKMPSQEWKDCSSRPVDPVHPICCGPSKVRPIFDAKIEMLEQKIVKHCLEIKDTNILLGQCCRSKEVLECQKLSLHHILLKLCCKIKELEKKLHMIKMAICCPKMPLVCSSSFDCREEIKNMRRLEEKLETCHNGFNHKECLLEICNKTVEAMKQEKQEWKDNMQEMVKIKESLQKQIQKMKEKVCKKAEGGKGGDGSMRLMGHRMSRRSGGAAGGRSCQGGSGGGGRNGSRSRSAGGGSPGGAGGSVGASCNTKRTSYRRTETIEENDSENNSQEHNMSGKRSYQFSKSTREHRSSRNEY